MQAYNLKNLCYNWGGVLLKTGKGEAYHVKYRGEGVESVVQLWEGLEKIYLAWDQVP